MLVVISVGNVSSHPRVKVDNTCLAQLKKVVIAEREYAKQILASGKTLSISFSFAAMVKQDGESGYVKENTSGMIEMSAKHRHIVEDEIDIFIDSRDVFTINNAQKSIMHTKSSPSALVYSSVNPYFDLTNDSLVAQYRFNKSDKYVDTELEREVTKYTIVPVNEKTALYSKVIISVDEDKQMIRRIIVWNNMAFSDEIKMTSILVKVRTVKEHSNISIPIRSKFLAANGEVNPKYMRYRYMDLTK